MRILIAEDELLERKAMKKFIQENFNDMTVVGEAVNGRQAIELAGELQPNIIFMDIKMPGINGLEAIEQIHATQPNIKFILVSAYDTFEYAKQAMKFGIKDYLLKPAKNEEIVRTLFRVREEILYEEKIAEEIKQSEQLLKEKLIRKLMKHPIDDETLQLASQAFSDVKSGYFLVCDAGVPIVLSKIEDTLADDPDQHFILHEVNGVAIILIISLQTREKSDQLLLARKLHLHLGENVFIGIGLLCDELSKLPTSYREAYEASMQLKEARQSKYGFATKSNQSHSNDQVIHHIFRSIEKGNFEEALMNFKEYEDLLSTMAKEKLYILIQSLFGNRNIEVPIYSISSLLTNKDWYTYLEVCCMKIQEYYQSKQSMQKAKEYIIKHYSNEVTLEDVAILVNLSPNYFSNLFKEEFGETFIELLTRTRMERARELIEKNAHSLKEISFLVGYKDPNYFSRVFKRFYDCSPRAYQRMIFN